jgi:hypothetical protein
MSLMSGNNLLTTFPVVVHSDALFSLSLPHLSSWRASRTLLDVLHAIYSWVNHRGSGYSRQRETRRLIFRTGGLPSTVIGTEID